MDNNLLALGFLEGVASALEIPEPATFEEQLFEQKKDVLVRYRRLMRAFDEYVADNDRYELGVSEFSK